MTTSLSLLMDRVAALLRDPLFAARAAANDQRVIGYVSSDIPVELILAADALPVRLRGASERPTPLADKYLESSFAPECRAIAEQYLGGQLDFLDAVIFPRSNDSAQRLYYYVCELQRRNKCTGPRPILFDVAKIARETSREHTLESLRRLSREIGTKSSQLPQALERTHARTSLINQLQSLQAGPSGILGSTAHRVRSASECDWSDSFDFYLASLLAAAPLHASYSRIVLCGSAPPDDRLHCAVESANGSIVGDLTDTTIEIDNTSLDALNAVAERCYHARTPAQQMAHSATWIADRAASLNADGVILWLIEEDEALPWEVAAQVQSLRTANIPVLALTRRRWLADATTLSEIARFVQSLDATR